MGDSFHRFGETLWGRGDWAQMPADEARIARALGALPAPDEAHRLPEIFLPAPAPMTAGPQRATHFVIEMLAETARAPAQWKEPAQDDWLVGALWWGRTDETWRPLAACADTPLQQVALAWSLGATPGWTQAELSAAFAKRQAGASALARTLGVRAVALEVPADAARRTLRLLHLRQRSVRTLELRLLATGRPFASAQIWNSAYRLGMVWGNLDLFRWPRTGAALFHLRALPEPGYFLPERAAEGERVAGLALFFELLPCPAPVTTFDRMALALATFRERFGGRPTMAQGAELDGDALEAERTSLAQTVAELESLGIAPGSPEALALF